jgi:hypothetical protein
VCRCAQREVRSGSSEFDLSAIHSVQQFHHRVGVDVGGLEADRLVEGADRVALEVVEVGGVVLDCDPHGAGAGDPELDAVAEVAEVANPERHAKADGDLVEDGCCC